MSLKAIKLYRQIPGKPVSVWAIDPELRLFCRKASDVPLNQRGAQGGTRYQGKFKCYFPRCPATIEWRNMVVDRGVDHNCDEHQSTSLERRKDALEMLVWSTVCQACHYFVDQTNWVDEVVNMLVPTFYSSPTKGSKKAEEFLERFAEVMWRVAQEGRMTRYRDGKRLNRLIAPDGEPLTDLNPRPTWDDLLAIGSINRWRFRSIPPGGVVVDRPIASRVPRRSRTCSPPLQEPRARRSRSRRDVRPVAGHSGSAPSPSAGVVSGRVNRSRSTRRSRSRSKTSSTSPVQRRRSRPVVRSDTDRSVSSPSVSVAVVVDRAHSPRRNRLRSPPLPELPSECRRFKRVVRPAPDSPASAPSSPSTLNLGR